MHRKTTNETTVIKAVRNLPSADQTKPFIPLNVIIVSKVFSRKLAPKNTRSGMIMELPPYHKAHWKHIIKEAFFKAWDIFKRALGTVILVSILFYVLSFSKVALFYICNALILSFIVYHIASIFM